MDILLLRVQMRICLEMDSTTVTYSKDRLEVIDETLTVITNTLYDRDIKSAALSSN